MSARSRNLWTLLGAAVVALGLAAYAYFGVMKGEEREAERKRNAERLVQPVSRPDGGTEQVRYDKLVVKAKGETTELARLPDQSWVIIRPLKAAADVRTAEDIVGTLQFARVKSSVEEKPTPDDLHRFGLDHPAVEVTASADGVAPLTVRLGLENPFDSTVYFQRDGDPKVYTFDTVSRASLEKTTFDLRDKDVLSVRDLGLTRVALRSRKHDWEVAREPGQPFAFIRPKKEEADTTAVSSWISTLRGSKATRFLQDTPEERKRTGVGKPDLEATFVRGSTETVRVKLATGRKESDPVYVLREDGMGTSLTVVPRTAIAALDKAPGELRDRTLLHAKPEDVAQIRFSGGPADSSLALRRERPTDGGLERWILASPSGEVDPFKASSLLYGLTSLRAEVADAPALADDRRTGLSKGRTVSLEGPDGGTLASAVLGASTPDGGTTYVRDDRGRVVLVETGRLKTLPATPGDLAPPKPPALPGADAGS
jgi:Domain of unknown function (DUF4340)